MLKLNAVPLSVRENIRLSADEINTESNCNPVP